MANTLAYYDTATITAVERFVRYQIDQTTYDTIWEVLDGRYGGDIRQDQQVQEEFEKGGEGANRQI